EDGIRDFHVTGVQTCALPIWTDDFPLAIRKKLQEVIELAHREEVDAVLHGGDLFDRPDISPAVVREFAALFRRLQVPLYMIAGKIGRASCRARALTDGGRLLQ